MLRCLFLIGGALVTVVMTPAAAEEPFAGRWALSTEACTAHGGDSAQNSALVASDTSLWWYDGYCRIGKMYKTTAFYVQVHCSGKDVSVTLDPHGDRLKITWNRGKPEELKRCQ